VDEVFVLSRTISQKLNLIIVLLYIEGKKLKSRFCFFTDGT